jgi:Galactose oxidase, central domain
MKHLEKYMCAYVLDLHSHYLLNPLNIVLPSIASLASPHRTNSLGEASIPQNQTMLWIYSMDENTWTPIIEPVHRNGVSWDNDLGSQDGEPEPRPRLGHSVVLDPGRLTFYVFGGNSGEGRRLDDFWSLSLIRWVIAIHLLLGNPHL